LDVPVYEIHGCTDKGPVREMNEDHILLGRLIKNRGAASIHLDANDDFLAAAGILCAVADGVGGAAGGAIASRLGLKSLDAQFYGCDKNGFDMMAWMNTIRAAASGANRSVLDAAAAKPELAAMACTLTGVCLCSRGLLCFNAGDSRVYRFRKGFLKQLTQDDSIASLARTAGIRTPESADGSNAITNSLGSARFHLDVAEGPEMKVGDMLLICSDGLYGTLSTDRIESLMYSAASARAAAEALMKAALSAAAQDNVSIVTVRLTDS
jgi:protein phosphatase